MLVEFDSKFVDVVADAVVRLRTLAPELEFKITEKGIDVGGEIATDRDAEIRQLVEQTLYRERIFRDTLPIRERIYNG